MSKRVSNSKIKRNGKLHARQTVRLGWRTKKARAKAIIAEFRHQKWLNEQAQGGVA